MPWINGILIGGAAIFLLWVGDEYGFNARKAAKCEAATEQRNAAIALANRIENAAHEIETAEREEADRVFGETAETLPACILTKEQADALNSYR